MFTLAIAGASRASKLASSAFFSYAPPLVYSTCPPQHEPLVRHCLQAYEADEANLDCFDSTYSDNCFSFDALPLVCSTWPPQHEPGVCHCLQAYEANEAHLDCLDSTYPPSQEEKVDLINFYFL